MAANGRRLAAVMFTDIVGYTSLTQLNEAKALELLRRHNALLRPLFPRFRGREIKTIGDSFLVEFESALDAAECAVELQRFLRQDNATRSPEDRVRVRIGIHLGDVTHTETDVFGDAVNVASRIEPLAEPEGICVTGPVFESVQNKVPHAFDKLEPKPLKNVRFPPAVYRIVLPWSGAEPPLVARSARNRIAVLPFANMSPNPEDAYFAGGITEELIQALSQLPGARVIARTSVEPYKERKKPVRDIGNELHVDTVLEGSVRRGGNQLRITVQLIRTDTEERLWSASYDRTIEDVFGVQSEIARTVASRLREHVGADVRSPVRERPVAAPASYLAYLKGRSLLRGRTETSLRAARDAFRRAIELDERNARAHAGLADVVRLLVWYGFDASSGTGPEDPEHIVRALQLDPELAEAHASWADHLMDTFRVEESEEEFRRAISLNPSYSTAHHWYSLLLTNLGRPEEALRELDLAEETDPLSSVVLTASLGLRVWLGRLDEARSRLHKLAQTDSAGTLYRMSATAYCLVTSDFTGAQALVEPQDGESVADPLLTPERGLYYALVGDPKRANDAIRELEALPETAWTRYDGIAAIHAALGDNDRCFSWLGRGLAKHALHVGRWRFDPLLERVRTDPRFAELLRRANAV